MLEEPLYSQLANYVFDELANMRDIIVKQSIAHLNEMGEWDQNLLKEFKTKYSTIIDTTLADIRATLTPKLFSQVSTEDAQTILAYHESPGGQTAARIHGTIVNSLPPYMSYIKDKCQDLLQELINQHNKGEEE